LHNEHVMKKEKEKAQFLISSGKDDYETYLDNVYRKSGLVYLWRYTKLKSKYHRISNILFGGR
jgi:hypothetical protein